MIHRCVYILAVVGAACGYRALLDGRRKRRVAARLRARPQLSDAEFGARYFPPEQARIAAEVRQLLSRYVPLRLNGLQPDDAFENDLQIATFGRTALTEFLMAAEERFEVRLRHRQGIVIRTVGDLVAAIARERDRALSTKRTVDAAKATPPVTPARPP